MDDVASQSIARTQLNMVLMTVFGAFALLLASIGVYALMAYSVQQRTREMGIRMALGAEANEVRNMVVVQGMRLSLAGILIGLAAAFGLSRLIQSLLFGRHGVRSRRLRDCFHGVGHICASGSLAAGPARDANLIRPARSHSNNWCNMTPAKVRRGSRMPRGVRPRR